MLKEVSARQMNEWIAFHILEGIGERRADLRNGILASLIANVHRDSKRKPSPFKPRDFMPQVKEDQERSAEAELAAALDAISVPAKGK